MVLVSIMCNRQEGNMNIALTLASAKATEQSPVSRYWFGSPCRFIRWLDLTVHVLFPLMLGSRLPRLTTYLRNTSPRWGRTWRSW